jgi:membrane-associated phospholipid phosphatase
MAAPASVLPPPWRAPAIVAAFAFGFGASLLRLAFGGHYLSDVLLGGLIMLIVIEVVRRVIWPLGASAPASLDRPGLKPSRGRDTSGRPAG